MKTKTTWVVVADGSTARILESTGLGQPLNCVLEIDPETSRDLIEDADRPGRVFESSDGARHSLQQEASANRKTAETFARQISEHLATAANARKYDRLILVAPPRFLGQLKDIVPKPILDLVLVSVNKDLTKSSDGDIARRLAELAPI